MSLEINHYRGGSGAPLLLIHGVGHHWQGWKPVLPLLEEQFAVFACDSPGFGASPPLPAGIPATIPNYVEAFATWIAEQGLDRPHVAGNSMGGAIAIELARRGLVRSATALSPAGFWSPAERRYCQRSLGLVAHLPRAVRPLVRAGVRTGLGRQLLMAQLVHRPGQLPVDLAIGSLDALWAAPAMDAALEGFTQYRCAPLPVGGPPVRVVWGQHDRLLLTRPQSRRAEAVLADCVHVQIPAGHVPFSDAPEAVAREIQLAAAAAPVPVS